jgi:purine-binding chemotaxis protein CheW
MENQLVVFDLNGEHFGVSINAVESIIKMQEITAVPRAPQFVEGVTSLRGTVLPVIDLRKRFGLPAAERNRDSRIVVTQIAGITAGMIVDGVSEVLRIPKEAIEPPSPLVMTVDSAFITGIAKADGKLVILLDLGKVLSLEDAAALRTMAVKA